MSANLKTIVVIGATGKQGGSVARVFASEPGWQVRGVTRDVSSKSSQALANLGVHMVAADLDRTSSLEAAFVGADAIFAVTDFWAPFYNPGTQALLREGQTLGEWCFERELRQMKNIADAASKTETLARIVVSSLVDAEKCSGGKYRGVYHWDGKARGVAYLRAQYPEMAKKMSVVIVGNYMENWLRVVSPCKDDGSYTLSLCGSGKAPLPHLDVGRDTGSIVRAAIQSQAGKNILAAGSMLSWSDQLQLWCTYNKVPFGGFDRLPIRVYDEMLPIPGLGKELGEMMEFMHEFGYTGDEVVVLPSELGVPCPLTTWNEFLKEQDWPSIMKLQSSP